MKRLLLVGGGHAHVEVLRRFGHRREPGVAVTLVSPGRWTPYSGMLPGYVAGHYGFEQVHIDLQRLARFAGAQLRTTAVSGLDPGARRARGVDGSSIDYDVASLDIGSAPDLSARGGAEHVLPVKPVDRFLDGWRAIEVDVLAGRVHEVGVVGGGAGGVEVQLALQYRVSQLGRGVMPRFHLITDMGDILPSHPVRVRSAFRRMLAQREVSVHTLLRVVAVDGAGVQAQDGRGVSLDRVIWATSASAQPWVAASGLAVDDRGFLAVGETLQSRSHPGVFAAGDIAAFPRPLPKSGVFAVRQGPALAANLRRALRGQALAPFRTSPRALALISTGDRYAVASRGDWAIEGAWVWRWKDWIDRRFMRRYRV